MSEVAESHECLTEGSFEMKRYSIYLKLVKSISSLESISLAEDTNSLGHRTAELDQSA